MNKRPFRMLILFVVFIMLVSGCSVIKTVSVLKSGEPAQQSFTEQKIPFTMKAHAILVKARVNDSNKTYNFMVDTGAINGIDKRVAHELMLKNEATIELFDSANNTKETNLVKFASLSIGNVKVKDCGAVLVDDLSSKIGVDGILGSNFMKYFRVTIDYKNHILVFANSRQELPAANRAEEVIPFTLNMKYGFAPKVACLVDGNISVDAIVDTGAIGLDLPVKIIKKTEEFSSGRVLASEGALTSGFTGTTRNDYLLRLKTFSMGGFKTANIPCGSTQSTVALFGQRALRHFLVTLDYPAGKMILKRYEDIEFDNNVYSLGIGIQKRKDKMIVTGLFKESPAAKAGIKIGDEVLKINSLDTGSLSMLEVMNILTDDQNRDVELMYLENGALKNVTLYKANLLPEYGKESLQKPTIGP